MRVFSANINVVSLVLIIVFLLPVIVGALSEFSRVRVRKSVTAVIESIEFVIGLVVSIYLAKKIFVDNDGIVYSGIYEKFPEQIKAVISGQDMLVYVFAITVLLFTMLLAVRLITGPLYRYVLIPFADLVYSGASLMGPAMKRIIGALWQLPKAAVITIVFTTILYFSMYYVYSPALTEWSGNSKEYQLIYNNILYPVFNSNIAKKIPVIIGDSFRKVSVGSASGRNIRIIHYFNGVTLDEAVKSNEQIDKKAREIAVKGKDEKEKAALLYKWISKNIAYDYAKAERIARDPMGEESGSIIAFETRKGICFDYSSLYVSMCRAIGLKVRLITGQGYSGISWGDHAWNQVWIGSEKRWINVDATFGSTGLNYFDKRNFPVDHEYAEIQGEW